MNCQEFDNRLDALLDDRIDPLHDQTLVEHTWLCEDCSRKLLLQDTLLQLLPSAVSVPEEAPPPELLRGTARAISSRLAALVTVAAGLLFVSLFGIPGRSTPNGSQVTLPALPPDTMTPPSLVHDMQLPQNSRRDLAAIDAHSGLAWTPSTMEAIFVEARPELTNISTRVARPFRPVAISVVSAWDVIRQTFPGNTRTS